MPPPSRTNGLAVDIRRGKASCAKAARRFRAPCVSFCQSSYLAQALKWKWTMAVSDFGIRTSDVRASSDENRAAVARPAAIRRMHDEPDFLQIAASALEILGARISLRLGGGRGCGRFRPAKFSAPFRHRPSGWPRICPASRLALCGQASQVASCGSHSAGIAVTQVGGSCCVCGLQVRHKDRAEHNHSGLSGKS